MVARHRLTLLRPAALRVRETLSAPPCPLPSEPQKRSRLMERKLRTVKPTRLAEVLRDLAWRQRTGQASEQDVRLLRRADRELARWLATQTGEETKWVRRRMWGLVDRAISRFA